MFAYADAERLAHATAGSVGGDQQARGDLALAIGIGDPDMAQSIAGIAQPDEARRAITGEVLQRCEPRFECLAEIARHHDAAEFLAPMRRGFQADAAEIAGATGVDAADAAARCAQQRHHAKRAQRVHGGLGEAEVALVEHRGQCARLRGFNHAHVQPEAIEGDRQAGADQPAADDQHVVRGGGVAVGVRHCVMLPAPLRAYPRYR